MNVMAILLFGKTSKNHRKKNALKSYDNLNFLPFNNLTKFEEQEQKNLMEWTLTIRLVIFVISFVCTKAEAVWRSSGKECCYLSKEVLYRNKNIVCH